MISISGDKGDATEQLVLPELFCPFPSVVNPYAEAVQQHTLDWLQHNELVKGKAAYERVFAANFGGLAARFHPDAPRNELQLVSDWYAWMFFQDDLRDESEIGKHPDQLAAMDARFLEILKGKEPMDRDGALGLALWDLQRRLRARVTVTWMRRFIRSVAEYFDATVWEATNRARGTTPDVVTYIRVRPLTSGLKIDTQFIEISHGIHLPSEVRADPVVSRLTLASNNAVCWANDIISLDKEIKRGDVHNLVLVLQSTEHLTLQQAIDRAGQMHDAEVGSFIELEPRLPSFGRGIDTNLQRYIAVLRARMRGHLEWSYASGRYQPAGLEPVWSTTIV